ncbi:MAG: fibronectin type III domain-containing protein [Cytophagales bacterium]|nr:fibronectin type III domain-containing protein [Cytophagales bacterium]
MKKIKYNILLIPVSILILVSISSCEKDDDDPNPKLTVPVLKDATDVKQTSFKISWGKVATATKYYVDVSKEKDFKTYVSGYKQKQITGTSITVSGLDAKTKYFVRVAAGKEKDKSDLSKVKEITTKSES